MGMPQERFHSSHRRSHCGLGHRLVLFYGDGAGLHHAGFAVDLHGDSPGGFDGGLAALAHRFSCPANVENGQVKVV